MPSSKHMQYKSIFNATSSKVSRLFGIFNNSGHLGVVYPAQ